MALGRREQDDRDHYANKRLDLGGPLLAGLFRQLFKKLTKDVRNHVQKAVDKGILAGVAILERHMVRMTLATGIGHCPPGEERACCQATWWANAGFPEILDIIFFCYLLV